MLIFGLADTGLTGICFFVGKTFVAGTTFRFSASTTDRDSSTSSSSSSSSPEEMEVSVPDQNRQKMWNSELYQWFYVFVKCYNSTPILLVFRFIFRFWTGLVCWWKLPIFFECLSLVYNCLLHLHSSIFTHIHICWYSTNRKTSTKHKLVWVEIIFKDWVN